jgi:hypothetical protein
MLECLVRALMLQRGGLPVGDIPRANPGGHKECVWGVRRHVLAYITAGGL